MNISSLVVHARPELAAAVRARLLALPGVQVHAAAGDGRFVVTLDAADDRGASDLFDRIGALPGVMSAALVYHQFEPDSEAGPTPGTAGIPGTQEACHDGCCCND